MSSIERVAVETYSWEDPRGWGLNVLAATGFEDQPYGDLHVVSLEPGAVRGNHVHRQGVEWLLICGGPVELLWAEEEGPTIRDVTGQEGPVLLKIPPGVAHAVRNCGKGAVFLVALGDRTDRMTEPRILIESA